MEGEAPKKKSSPIKWIIAIIVFVLIASLLIIFYNKNKQTTYDGDDSAVISAVASTDFADSQNYIDQTFKVSEYDDIPQNYKLGIVKIFIANDFYEPADISEKYHLTSIKDRARKVFAFGDFTGQTEENKSDIAFLVESEDFSSSILFIMSSKGDVLYKKSYSGDLPIINSFNKGAKIFMDSEKLEVSPEDGLIVKFKYYKNAIVYNQKSKGFDEYRQYSSQDLSDMKDEREYLPDDAELGNESDPDPN